MVCGTGIMDPGPWIPSLHYLLFCCCTSAVQCMRRRPPRTSAHTWHPSTHWCATFHIPLIQLNFTLFWNIDNSVKYHIWFNTDHTLPWPYSIVLRINIVLFLFVPFLRFEYLSYRIEQSATLLPSYSIIVHSTSHFNSKANTSLQAIPPPPFPHPPPL